MWFFATLFAILLLLSLLYLVTHGIADKITRKFPPRGQCVETPGGRLHVTRRDPPGAAKATIVLVHGASGNQADMMEPLGPLLIARGYRVWAVDRPGHGHSERRSAEAFTPSSQATAIRVALEALGVRSALIVGHSWSGALAANFLLDHRDFTEGAILLAPVTHPWPGGVRWYYSLAAQPWIGAIFCHCFVLPMALAQFDSGIASVFAPKSTPDRYAERTGVALTLRPKHFLANARDVVELRRFLAQQAPRMTTINRPVAIVTGDQDSVILTELHSHASAREIPHARLTILQGIGHSPHWSEPQTVIEAIEDVYRRSRDKPDVKGARASGRSDGA